MNDSQGKYYIKRNDSDTFVDITTMFDGVAVLSLDGFFERGEALNVYHEQWIDSQEEDFMIASSDNTIIRKNVDLSLTVAVSRRYTENGFDGNEDEQSTYDTLVDYFNQGAFYIKSNYANKIAKVVCLDSIKPTLVKLNRGDRSFITATISLHILDALMDRKQWVQLIDSDDNPVYDSNGNAIQMLYYL